MKVFDIDNTIHVAHDQKHVYYDYYSKRHDQDDTADAEEEEADSRGSTGNPNAACCELDSVSLRKIPSNALRCLAIASFSSSVKQLVQANISVNV